MLPSFCNNAAIFAVIASLFLKSKSQAILPLVFFHKFPRDDPQRKGK
jgi:hypothetical protein